MNRDIADFGLAKRTDDEDLTLPGQILGSPGFVAPEQAAGREAAAPLADVYSLGAILDYLLTTRPPFVAATDAEALRLVLECEPVGPRALNPAVPRDLETICLKCLEKNPARRYGSAREVEVETGRFLRGEAIVARPLSATAQTVRWRARHRAVAALIATVVAALVTTTAVFYAMARRVERARPAELRAQRVAEENLYAEMILNSGVGLNTHSPALHDLRRSLEVLRPAPGGRDLRGFE